MKNYLIFGFILSAIFIPIASYADNVELEISAPKIVDSTGNTVNEIFAPLNGVPFAYQPSAILQNTGTSPIDFTFYAMVDDGNELLELSSFSASINPNQDFTLALTWNPQKDGKHTLIFGVWNNLGEKNDLITPIELDVNVLSKDSSTNSIQIASFVDPTKDPQSYIDRYNNEESYKEWFDENYPDYTIEEAVGISKPIPGWIKNNADWWSEGLISEDCSGKSGIFTIFSFIKNWTPLTNVSSSIFPSDHHFALFFTHVGTFSFNASGNPTACSMESYWG